jgi:hypothetical protein
MIFRKKPKVEPVSSTELDIVKYLCGFYLKCAKLSKVCTHEKLNHECNSTGFCSLKVELKE